MLDRLFSTGLDLFAFVTPISIAATNIVFFPLAGLWLIKSFFFKREWPFHNAWPERLFVLFLLISVISALAGIDRARSFKVIFNSDFYILIAFFLVALVQRADKNERLLKIFMLSGLLTALYGLFQYAMGVNQTDKSNGYFISLPSYLSNWPRPVLDELSLVNGRLIGTRSHPLHYAECLLFHWGFGIYYLVLSQGRQTLKWLAYLGVIGLALLFTQSRGPWLAAMGMVGVAVLLNRTPKALWLVGVGCAFLSAFLLVPNLSKRAVSITDSTHHSNRDRLNMWHAGIKMWKSHPLLGLGPGGAKIASPPFQEPRDRPFGPWGHLHSTYINTLSERGALGILALFAVFAAIIREIWLARAKARTPYENVLYNGALLGMVGFLASGVTETVYNAAVVMMMFYLAMGLALALARNDSTK